MQRGEQLPLAGLDKFRAGELERTFQHGNGPTPLKEAVGGYMVNGLCGVAFFGPRRIEAGHHRRAAFLCLGAVVLVGEKIPDTRKQESAQLAFGGIGSGEDLFLDESREEALRQILRIVGILARVADVSVDRIPVRLAEPRQCLEGGGIIRAAGASDRAPVGSLEGMRRGVRIHGGRLRSERRW